MSCPSPPGSARWPGWNPTPTFSWRGSPTPRPAPRRGAKPGKRSRWPSSRPRELAARFLAATAFRPGRSARLAPTRANGQPAFGLYIRNPQAPVAHANGILVLTLAGSQISAMTGFLDNSALRNFGLPRTLPD